MYIYSKENSQTIFESLKAYRETTFDYSNPEVSRLRVKDMPDDILDPGKNSKIIPSHFVNILRLL